MKEFMNSSASTRNVSVQECAFLQPMFNQVHRTGKSSHGDIDSMIRKSIKLLFMEITAPAATLQNVDRSTMSSASIQSQSPRSFVNNLACQPRLSRNIDRSTMSSASIQSQSPRSFVNKISTLSVEA